MPSQRRRSRQRKSKRNPAKRFLKHFSTILLALVFLGVGVFIGLNLNSDEEILPVVINESKDDKTNQVLAQQLTIKYQDNINKLNQLNEGLQADQNKAEKLSEKLSNENSRLKSLLKKNIADTSEKNEENIDKLNKLSEKLQAEQKKTEKLSEELTNKNIRLKNLLSKEIAKNSNTRATNEVHIDIAKQVEKHQKHSSGQATTIAQTDYYNKVRISLSSKKENESLQDKVNSLIETKPSKIETEVTYIKTLSKEATQRENQVRTITLESGDTLWSLAVRAYGDGALYTKILEANPQLNRDGLRSLITGTELRVPQ